MSLRSTKAPAKPEQPWRSWTEFTKETAFKNRVLGGVDFLKTTATLFHL
jgi:hypothetical protein